MACASVHVRAIVQRAAEKEHIQQAIEDTADEKQKALCAALQEQQEEHTEHTRAAVEQARDSYPELQREFFMMSAVRCVRVHRTCVDGAWTPRVLACTHPFTPPAPTTVHRLCTVSSTTRL